MLFPRENILLIVNFSLQNSSFTSKFYRKTMYYLKEFLETSTIHGLAFISTAPSKVSKLFWVMVVFFGFSTAFYLINSSYNDWQSSPIATSISTHPISELDFPTVTICPPEGSNTALNYDLARARNITL